ncbi:PAS domain protein [Shimia sp. SK013]|uniref:PAS domain-containing protein n=1 Tax=Shimia sp. SK013 TaxID=1389006 RepID=UPI0006B6493A|nr:PAS domain-containing protein [Shimia sp. SK013]KPA22558.1 PAS domain protein [Shimia sp. SK013]
MDKTVSDLSVENGRDGALVLDRMEDYWSGLRRGKTVPYRSDVDPRSVQRMLRHAFILERLAPGVGKLRVSCSTLTDLQGMDMRGMPIASIISEESREEFAEILEQVFAGPATARLELSTSRGFRKNGKRASMLLLPLRSDSGEINRVLGAVSVFEIGRNGPTRFDLTESLLHDVSVKDDGLAERLSARPVTLVDRQKALSADERQASTVATRHAHLRLVVSDT